MKHKVKMIVTDLDGTLLRSDKTISEYTKTVLRRCRETGIKVAYATGRGGSNENIVPPEFFDGIITTNGATALAGNELVYSRPVPFLRARPILIDCDKRGLKIASQTSSMHYSNFEISKIWPDITNFKTVDFRYHNKDAEKIYIHKPTEEDIGFMEAYLGDDLYMISSMDGVLMIMHKAATKSKAAAELAKFWNIDREEIVAFGDDLNDRDMLIYAGIGVAMENALPEIKAVSDYMCKNNDKDGFAKWIEENVY